MNTNRIAIILLLGLTMFAWGAPKPDSTKFDRSIQGRPFDLEEILGEAKEAIEAAGGSVTPEWVLTKELPGEKFYYGIGQSRNSSDAADDDARLRFAQYVEVKVQSIATQQIAENKDRLEENYSFESLVSTNMNLRSVKISERHVTPDSTFYSLIRYGKSEYHDLVTDEIRIALESDIKKQELAHQAQEALRADSLRHKLTMDSLSLGRKQAVIDSLDHILKMEEAKQQQDLDRIDLIKKQYAAFLSIKPHYQLIDVPSAAIPESWIHISGRWNPDSQDIHQLKAGIALWLISAEASVWATESIVDQSELSVKLQLLPQRGELYPVSLALGWVGYLDAFTPENRIHLRKRSSYNHFIERMNDEITNPLSKKTSFFITGTVGIPHYNNHLSIYADKRKISVANIWYPFPRNMGDAVSIINQFDVIRETSYRNRFEEQFQWQIGLRLIAIPDRFATMVSYEEHEYWLLNFEFQY